MPNKRDVVCIKHFTKEDIITFGKFKDFSGVEYIIERRCLALKPVVFPTVFFHYFLRIFQQNRLRDARILNN